MTVTGPVLGGTLGLVSVGYAQTGGGIMSLPGRAFGRGTDPSMVPITSGFRLIPSLMVGERYDNNVLFAPNRSPGKLDDIERQAVQVNFTRAFH